MQYPIAKRKRSYVPSSRARKPKTKFTKLEKDVKKMKKLVNADIKSVEINVATLGINPLGTLINCNLIPNGSQDGQRVGNVVINERLRGYMTIKKRPTSIDYNDFVRFIMFRDLDHNGTAPAVTDVLEFVGYDSPLNWTNRKRYSILEDSTHTLGCVLAGDVNGQTGYCKKINRKLGQAVYYQGAGALEADIENGPVYILLLTSASTGNHEPVVETNLQLLYSDS